MKKNLLDLQTRRFGRILHYAGLLATVVCMTAGYSLLHAPVVEDVRDTAEQIEQLRLSVQNSELIREQHEKVSQVLASVKERIASVQQRVPASADAGEFLKEVSRLAAEEHLTVRDFQPDKMVPRSGYAQMEVTLTGRGSYASICTFFDRLSKLTRLSKLQNLTLTASGNAAEYPVIATLVIYFELRSKDSPPSTAPSGRGTGKGEVKRG